MFEAAASADDAEAANSEPEPQPDVENKVKKKKKAKEGIEGSADDKKSKKKGKKSKEVEAGKKGKKGKAKGEGKDGDEGKKGKKGKKMGDDHSALVNELYQQVCGRDCQKLVSEFGGRGWVGGVGGGGLGYLSLRDGWEWQVGRVTYILAQMWENGAPKAPEIFFGLLTGEIFFFYPMCLYSKCSGFRGEFKCG